MNAGLDAIAERLLKLSGSNHWVSRKVTVFLVPTFLLLILIISPAAYAQDDFFSPFSSSDGRPFDALGAGTSSAQDSNQNLQTELRDYQPIFLETGLKAMASSKIPSPISDQNMTQKQATSLNSSVGHSREPLTQYQTVVQTPARTLTVQPTGTLPPATVYPPGISVPSLTGTGGTTVFPQSTLAGTGTLPPSAVTFPPSVFPPTTSFIPPTSIAPVLGPLSPWFPSIPAIACGGTFTFSVVGSLDRDNDNGNDNGHNNNKNKNGNDNNNNNNNNNEKDKLYAIQIQSNGGSTLDTDSIEGKVFAGEKNIERNNGEDFDIKDVFNDCQVVTYSN
jgi:hypothetical protein